MKREASGPNDATGGHDQPDRRPYALREFGYLPVPHVALEDRSRMLKIGGRSYLIPTSAMWSRYFRFLIPEGAEIVGELGIVIRRRPGQPGGSKPAVVLEDGSCVDLEPVDEGAGGSLTGPLAGASLHVERPAGPTEAT